MYERHACILENSKDVPTEVGSALQIKPSPIDNVTIRHSKLVSRYSYTAPLVSWGLVSLDSPGINLQEEVAILVLDSMGVPSPQKVCGMAGSV